MKRSLPIALAAVSAVLAGCIDVETVVAVKKDGRASIVETAYVSTSVQEMLQRMMSGVREEETQGVGLRMNESEYEAKARSMGEGVRLVSVREVRREDGAKGVRVVYAVDDISRLRLNSEPETPGSPLEEHGKPITFEFAPGDAAKLIVNLPHNRVGSGNKSAILPAMQSAPSPPAPAELMKQMLAGFRLRMLVIVDGEISESNASFIQEGVRSGRRNQFLLFDVNIGELIKDAESFKELAAMSDLHDMETAMAKLRSMSGLKVETAEQVEVLFK